MVRRSHRQKVEGKRIWKAGRKSLASITMPLVSGDEMERNEYIVTIRGNEEKMRGMKNNGEDYCFRLEDKKGCEVLWNLLKQVGYDRDKVSCFKTVDCYCEKGIFCKKYKSWKTEKGVGN